MISMLIIIVNCNTDFLCSSRPVARGSEQSDDHTALKGHFSANCSSANILNIVRLWNRINRIEYRLTNHVYSSFDHKATSSVIIILKIEVFPGQHWKLKLRKRSKISVKRPPVIRSRLRACHRFLFRFFTVLLLSCAEDDSLAIGYIVVSYCIQLLICILDLAFIDVSVFIFHCLL